MRRKPSGSPLDSAAVRTAIRSLGDDERQVTLDRALDRLPQEDLGAWVKAVADLRQVVPQPPELVADVRSFVRDSRNSVCCDTET